MRFREHLKPCDAAGAFERGPLRVAARVEIEIVNELREERPQDRNITKQDWRAAVSLDDPFDAGHRTDA